jgi:outer membrane protein
MRSPLYNSDAGKTCILGHIMKTEMNIRNMWLKMNRPALVVGCLLVGCSPSLLARVGRVPGLDLQAGVVVSANTSYYKGAGEEVYILPLVLAEYRDFYLEGIRAGYRVYKREDGQVLSFEVARTFDGYESNDSSFLTGMAERKDAWEAGLVYEAQIAGGWITGKLMQDFSDVHDGYSLRVDYERRIWRNKTIELTGYAGGEFWDRKKSDTYFGVRDSEARPDRPAYAASESLFLFLGSNFIKQLTPTVSLIASMEYRLGSDSVDDSPVVRRTDQWSVYSGIFYRF